MLRGLLAQHTTSIGNLQPVQPHAFLIYLNLMCTASHVITHLDSEESERLPVQFCTKPLATPFLGSVTGPVTGDDAPPSW